MTVGAADKNVDNMLPLIKGAASSGAQIIALPELCITGYTCSDLFSQDRLIEARRPRSADSFLNVPISARS